MAVATIPGYPRIGKHRELKRALEAFWAGKTEPTDLLATAGEIYRSGWQTQQQAGLDLIPINDFSFYDQILDTLGLLGARPERYRNDEDQVGMDTYFAMARGRSGDRAITAMEMTKWFDTNYHYIVPELGRDTEFSLSGSKPFVMVDEANKVGITSKVVLVGPVTFLSLAKSTTPGFDPLTLLEKVLPVYVEIVQKLSAAGAGWIQFDEPILVTDVTPEQIAALTRSYAELAVVKGDTRVIVQTYFDRVEGAWDTLLALPVDGIGLDFVRGPGQVERIIETGFPKGKVLVAGVIDGRNVWAADLPAAFATLQRLEAVVGSENIHVSTSCSLQHVPYDVERETDLDPEVKSWLAFAEQKLAEVTILTRGLNEGKTAIATELQASADLRARAAASPRRTSPEVQQRLADLPNDADQRALPYAERATLQQERLHLPLLPTTTIGSFPQTAEVRAARRRFERGDLTVEDYDTFIEGQIRDIIKHQEALGLDVLVHGESERNDMVQYFGEQLDGFAFTRHGWVQSYGSRYVRPPLIYGDVSRPQPMTVRWAEFAQAQSQKPVKGMLTGPVTILNWSFVRDDQPRSITCKQIALAIRDEVADLDAAGIAMIQIDEAALREGLPLHRADWAGYLAWAVESFRITAGVARPETQIHTHMCYSEFGDIFQAISDLDADVISIENARSGLELLESFQAEGYDKGVGPGVYDIHSPRVPPAEEMATALRQTVTVIDPARVWVNPDCGLKTRRPEESTAALENMVAAARAVRAELDASTS
jgi:5-methyltetrahydropteroyltriglutamate--homocysteine methyltransferase